MMQEPKTETGKINLRGEMAEEAGIYSMHSNFLPVLILHWLCLPQVSADSSSLEQFTVRLWLDQVQLIPGI